MLLNPIAYSHTVNEIVIRDTHVSWVFLTGKYAYKVKKPVKFGDVLDFSTLERRKHFCELEIELNIKENVVFTGFRENPGDYMNMMDVVIHSSILPEPFGMVLLEAMYLGKPVIATGYSGNMDFMNVNNSFLIRYKLIDVGEKDYPPFKMGYVWADPDIDHAAELMRTIYENKKHADEIGKQGSKDIKELFSPEAAGQVIRTRLERILEIV